MDNWAENEILEDIDPTSSVYTSIIYQVSEKNQILRRYTGKAGL